MTILLQQQSVQNMEWPYGSCTRNGTSREKLTADCVERKTNEIFRCRSPMSIVKEGNGMKILSIGDLENTSRKKYWRKIARECNNMYTNTTGCTEQRLVTAIDERRIGENFTIYEMVPSLPSMDYSNNPQMDIEDLLIFIGSILSTGFGFALYTCLPCRWNRTKKDGACCGCGFSSEIPDDDEKRVEDLEEALEGVIAHLTTLEEKVNQSGHGQAAVVHDEMANLEDEMGNLYQFRKINSRNSGRASCRPKINVRQPNRRDQEVVLEMDSFSERY